MKIGTLAGTIVLTLVLGLGCGGQLRESGELTRIVQLEQSAEAGASLYVNKCGLCHGRTGLGGSAPSLRMATPSMSDEELAEQILEGGFSMPAIRVPPQEAMHIVAWLRAEFPRLAERK